MAAYVFTSWESWVCQTHNHRVTDQCLNKKLKMSKTKEREALYEQIRDIRCKTIINKYHRAREIKARQLWKKLPCSIRMLPSMRMKQVFNETHSSNSHKADAYRIVIILTYKLKDKRISVNCLNILAFSKFLYGYQKSIWNLTCEFCLLNGNLKDHIEI